MNAQQSRPLTPIPSVSPGRPPPPSVKNTTGSRIDSASVEQPILLAMVLLALRAGQHGVVVGHCDDLRRVAFEQVRR